MLLLRPVSLLSSAVVAAVSIVILGGCAQSGAARVTSPAVSAASPQQSSSALFPLSIDGYKQISAGAAFKNSDTQFPVNAAHDGASYLSAIGQAIHIDGAGPGAKVKRVQFYENDAVVELLVMEVSAPHLNVDAFATGAAKSLNLSPAQMYGGVYMNSGTLRAPVKGGFVVAAVDQSRTGADGSGVIQAYGRLVESYKK